jgi:iron complex transport system substrate-binding protein
MRIASLLPSATEIVCAIGLETELVAISADCDYPPSIADKPVVTRRIEPAAAGDRTSREIHAQVAAAARDDTPLTVLDADGLADARPDLIITQATCPACAISTREVDAFVRDRGLVATVVSLSPTSIEGILNSITTVGAMAEVEDAAIDLVESLRERLGKVEERVATRREGGRRAPRVVALEWLDPPFAVGHWVPEQVRRAGGWDLLGADGEPARPTSWDALADVDPEMLFLMPCGFHLADTVREWARTPVPPWLADLPAVRAGAVFALDGSSYFSRPGPRVIAGIELLAEIMDPDAFVDVAPADSWTPVSPG